MMTNSSCSAGAADCFHGVTLPDARRVVLTVTNGQAGRDIAEAVLTGHADRARVMLAADPALATTHVPVRRYPDFQPDGEYGDLLTFAVARCDARMLDTLLHAGVAANGAVPGNALDLALQGNRLSDAERLLAAGGSPDPQKTTPGAPWPLVTAGRKANPEAATLLIRHGADLGWTDSTGTSALQTIVDMDSMRVAEVLIEAGADPWAVGPDGALPAFGIAQPLRLVSPEEEQARQRLIARLSRPGLPWPPPDPAALRAAVREGRWPPASALALGVKPVSEAVIAAIRQRKD